MTHLQIGDPAPEFKLLNQDNEEVSSKDYQGKKLIVFFYPKDNTPGCTAEACSIRDNYVKLKRGGYEILGVSPDSPKKHRNFIEKFDFQYPLLADTDQEMMKAFGIWGPKTFMGKNYIGVHRSTFVIDEEGKIEKIYSKVKTKEHGSNLANDLLGIKQR